MSLCLFNLVRAANRFARSAGMVLATVSRSVERHQTALRGLVASTSANATVTPKRDASETSPCRPTGHSKRTARSPQGDGVVLASAEGIETPGRRSVQREAASAQLVVDSVVGPHRSPAPSSHRGHLFSSGLISSSHHPVTGAGANPIATGSGVCRSETEEVKPQRMSRRSAVAVVPQFGRVAPRTGPEFHASRSVHVFSLRQGFGFGRLNLSGSASRRRAPASSTGGTPSGRSSLPAPTGPCACRASSLAAASSSSPPAAPGSSGTPPR